MIYFLPPSSSVNVAKRLHDDCFGLVFGLNTLMALIFQTCLTQVVVTGLALGAIESYTVYSAYFGVLGVVYAIAGVVQLFFPIPESKVEKIKLAADADNQ